MDWTRSNHNHNKRGGHTLSQINCRLCGLEKRLVDAHIIPDFMYHELYDENHWLYKVVLGNPIEHSKIPTGEYDPNILCEDCDVGRIGQFEDYAAKVYTTGAGIESTNIHCKDINVTITHTKNIDYKKFKLFLLSILWRSSITKRELFSEVKLGPYEASIRDMIYYEDPKEPTDFPCLILLIRSDVQWASELIKPPTRSIDRFHTRYHFLIGGVSYIYYVGEKIDLPEFIISGAVNKSNEMKLFHVNKGEGQELLKTYLGFNK